MNHDVGIWIDHQKAVIVFASEAGVTATTFPSDVEGHPRHSGQQDGGGEKKYEERHRQHLDHYYDEVIGQLGHPQALLIFGPGEAKLELEERLRRHVNRRTGRRAGEYFEDVLIARHDA